MEMRSVLCAVILFISLVIADARSMEPVFKDESESSITRKAEEALNSLKLFDEAYKLSVEACLAFPTNLQDECLKKSGAYLHEARAILREFFKEGHLCNGTELCAKSESKIDNYLVMNELNDELRDNEKSCSVCKKAVRELISRLKQPKMRSKIVEALLDYCEEADEDEDQCKRMIYRYGPVILHKLEKFKPSEMCSMIGMCEEEIAMKI